MGCLPLAAVHHFRLTKGFPKNSTTVPSSRSERHLTVFCIDQIVPGYVVSYLNKKTIVKLPSYSLVLSINTYSVAFALLSCKYHNIKKLIWKLTKRWSNTFIQFMKKCEICNTAFTQKVGLKRHVARFHEGKKTI